METTPEKWVKLFRLVEAVLRQQSTGEPVSFAMMFSLSGQGNLVVLNEVNL